MKIFLLVLIDKNMSSIDVVKIHTKRKQGTKRKGPYINLTEKLDRLIIVMVQKLKQSENI